MASQGLGRTPVPDDQVWRAEGGLGEKQSMGRVAHTATGRAGRSDRGIAGGVRERAGGRPEGGRRLRREGTRAGRGHPLENQMGARRGSESYGRGTKTDRPPGGCCGGIAPNGEGTGGAHHVGTWFAGAGQRTGPADGIGTSLPVDEAGPQDRSGAGAAPRVTWPF